MKTILITGFEPFAGDAKNPSWQTVKELPDQIGQWQVIKKEIPVTFADAQKQILKLIEQLNPDAVIATGYNAAADRLHLEYVALNLDHARIPDNNGQQPRQKPIEPGGPPARETRLPVFELEAKLEKEGVPAKVSFSAGTYVCNHVMYTLLSVCQKRNIPGGFIHIPPLQIDEPCQKEQNSWNDSSKRMTFAQARQGLGEIIRNLE